MSTLPSRRRFEPAPIEIGKLFDKQPPHALETECALLGSMILDSQVIGDVVEIIQSSAEFYKPSHTVIYEVLIHLFDHNLPVDVVQITQRLKDMNQLENIGGIDYIVMLAESVPAATSAAHYARIVHDKSTLRRLIDSAGRILHNAYTTADPVDEQLDSAEQAIFQLAETKISTDASSIQELLDETYKKLEMHDGELISGLETGFARLDELTSGLHNGELAIVAARPSMGKAQPLTAKVLTLGGWRAMGDLRVGDELASVDGQRSVVVGIYPQGQRPVYRVTLADGRSTECCAEHLWRVHYRGWDEPRVLTTARLITMLGKKRYDNRLWIETFTGDFGENGDLPLDPWLLGCLIGDGSLSGSSVRVSTADEEMLAQIRITAGPQMAITHAGAWDYRIVHRDGPQRAGVQGSVPNPVKSALMQLGLWDCDAATKFIPETYMNASREFRVRLLAGLIDTDGWVEKWGSLRFCTVSRRLAQDIVNLVRSLGGTASFSSKNTTYVHKGKKLSGATAFVCNLQHADAASFAILERKRQRLENGRTRQRRLNIQSIEPVGEAQTQCIAVSHPSHLYITDDYIVTHNTAFAMNIAEHIAVDLKQSVAVFSLEMSKQQLAQRLLCSRSKVDSQRLRRNMLQKDDWFQLQRACGELADAPLYIDDSPGLSLLSLRAKARRIVARHQVKVIFIDYLQLMSGPKSDSREQEVSAISRGIKALARELNVPVVCLSQLNRGPENREGHRPRMSDLRESGSIEQDADIVLMLHREDYYHRGEEGFTPDNTAEVIIAKQRNGPTDTVKLYFESATTRFGNLATY